MIAVVALVRVTIAGNYSKSSFRHDSRTTVTPVEECCFGKVQRVLFSSQGDLKP